MGLKDGSYSEARFNRLQGVTYHKNGMCVKELTSKSDTNDMDMFYFINRES